MKQVIQGWSPDYPDPTAFLQTMTKNNAQNNTDWNKEYDQLLKDANSKFYESQVNVIPHYKKRNISYYMKRQSLLFIKRRSTLNESVKGLQYHKVGPETIKHVYIDKSINRETGK